MRLQREQMEESTRPVVYPNCTHEFTSGTSPPYDVYRLHLLPLKNGGPGIALNVRGVCFVPGSPEIRIEIAGGTIAAGDTLDARLETPLSSGWNGVKGMVRYEDIEGQLWGTQFTFGRGGGQLTCSHDPPERLT